MKINNLILVLVLGLVLAACGNDTTAEAVDRAPSTPGSDGSTAVTAPVTPATAPSVNSGVEHYICPNGHVGSGGAAAGNCAQCGTALEHNQAYHNNPSTPSTTPSIQPTTTTAVTPPAPTSPEPPQNAAGVWHYTCSNGCAGGGGGATPCASCGTALVHNTAYHQ